MSDIETPATCEFEACSGRYHDPDESPADWRHEVFVAESFDGGTVDAAISVYSDGRPPVGDIYFDDHGDMLTPAEFRRLADEYAKFPAWLRSMADRMDALKT